MSTGTQLVQGAARKIGVHSDVDPMTTESLIVGFEILLPLLQLWQSQGIKFQFVATTLPGEDIFEPADVTNAIKNNLAIAMAPDFEDGEIIVSPMLENIAESDYEWIKTLYQVFTVPNKVASSLLPRGSGNSKGIFRKVFNGKDGTIGN